MNALGKTAKVTMNTHDKERSSDQVALKFSLNYYINSAKVSSFASSWPSSSAVAPLLFAS
jgi:hypothetical protein